MQKESGISARFSLFYSAKSQLIYQFIVFSSEARKKNTITVAALDSHLENLKFWSQIILHRSTVFKG